MEKNQRRFSINDFDIVAHIGSGGYGDVYLARTIKKNRICVIKKIEKEKCDDHAKRRQAIREIEIQRSLKHQNILRIYSYFHCSDYIHIVLEYAPGGSVFDLLKQCEKLSEAVAAKIIDETAVALSYCHEKQVIHRDVKPENLLLGSDGEVKLSDFGVSIIATDLRETVCGTEIYRAPEMVKGKYTNSVDLWAIGVLCYELLVGTPPFKSEGDQLFEAIKKARVTYSDNVKNDPRDLIGRLLVVEPEQRCTLKDVRTHHWILSETENSKAEKQQKIEKAANPRTQVSEE